MSGAVTESEASNELDSRTLVDRRARAGRVARSSQAARAPEATTPGNPSLGGRRRRRSHFTNEHGSADRGDARGRSSGALSACVRERAAGGAGSECGSHVSPNERLARVVPATLGCFIRGRRCPQLRKKETLRHRQGFPCVHFSRAVRFTRPAVAGNSQMCAKAVARGLPGGRFAPRQRSGRDRRGALRGGE